MYDSFESREKIIAGYISMISDKTKNGYEPYLLSFMFEPLRGNERTKQNEMRSEIERVFSKLIARVQRYPSRCSQDELPILIAATDMPVVKFNEKNSIVDVVQNDGLHFHAILLVPKLSRLKTSVSDHFENNQSVYLSARLKRIDVAPITHGLDRTIDYALKSVKAGRISDRDAEAILVLPRSRSER
jgi:hypothetical protein